MDNALRVVLLGEHHSLRLTDVSKYLGVSSTAHRLLAILQYRGYVQQDAATRSYVPGPTLDSLAFGLLRRLDARDRARPVLERLNNDLGETVHLGRLEGNEVHFIDSIESDRALRVANRLGRSMPAHCTSTGKALLAMLTDDELHLLYPDERLIQLTPHSLGTRTELLDAVRTIRSRGVRVEQGGERGGCRLPRRRTGLDPLSAVGCQRLAAAQSHELGDRAGHPHSAGSCGGGDRPPPALIGVVSPRSAGPQAGLGCPPSRSSQLPVPWTWRTKDRTAGAMPPSRDQ